jgi:hypothetical protein
MTRRTVFEYLVAGISGITVGLLGLYTRPHRPAGRDEWTADRLHEALHDGWQPITDPWERLTRLPLPADVCLDGMEHRCAIAYICGMYGLQPKTDHWPDREFSYFLPFGAGVRPWTEPGVTGAEALARICGATRGRIRPEGGNVLVYERNELPANREHLGDNGALQV